MKYCKILRKNQLEKMKLLEFLEFEKKEEKKTRCHVGNNEGRTESHVSNSTDIPFREIRIKRIFVLKQIVHVCDVWDVP